MDKKYRAIYEAAKLKRKKEENAKPSDYDFGVDAEYIDSFYKDFKKYVEDAEKEYDGINYDSDVTGLYDRHSASMSALRERADNIRAYLNANKKNLNEKDYSSMISGIGSMRNSLDSIGKNFQEKRDYFSQWETKDEYEAYVKSQKEYEGMKTADLDALDLELKGLKQTKDKYNSLKAERDKRYATVYGGYLRAGYEDKFAKEKALEDVAEYDKQLSSYGDISGVDKKITDKTAYYNRAKHIQKGIKLTDDATKADDFDENSVYVSTDVDKSKLGFWDRLTAKEYDEAYEYINDVNGRRDDIKHKHDVYSSDNPFDDGETEYEEKAYDYITSEEKAIYNYYYATEGEQKANEYLNSIQETLYNRKANSQFKNLEGNTFAEMAFGVYAGLNQFTTGMENLFNTQDEYIPVNDVQQTSGMVRNDLADTGGNIFGSSIGQAGYDLITTTTNMLPSILASTATNFVAPGAGAFVGAGLMGGSAAGNAYQEMLNLGYDKGQARAYSSLVGASEAGLQYLLGGVGKLGGKLTGGALNKIIEGVDNAFARTAIKLGGNMLSEGIEEGLQEILSPFFENLVLHAENGWEDINWSQVAYSGLLGALSAGMLEGGSTISEAVNTYKAGKSVKDAGQTSNLKEFGLSMSPDTVAYKLAGKVNEKTGAYTIGRLLHEAGADSLSESNTADIVSTLEGRGIAPQYAKTIAKWMNKAVEGGTLSKRQQMALEYNEDIGEVFKDVIINKNSTVNQRLLGYNDIVSSTEFNDAVEQVRQKTAKEEQKPIQPEVTSAVQEWENKQTESKTDADSNFEVSADGKAINNKTNEFVDVVEIVSIADGEMTLKLDSGETVNAKDISFATNDESIIYSAVLDMGVNAAVANSIVKKYDPSDGVSAQKYALGVKEAYKYGLYNIPVSEMSGKVFSADLTVAQRTHAYNLGRSDARASVEKAQNVVKAEKNNQTVKQNGKGKVHFKGNKMALTERQSVSIKALEKVADALGVNFYIYESRVENGKRVYTDVDGVTKPAPNGKYYSSDGSIHIDLYAGNEIDKNRHLTNSTILFTAAHELTHHIKKKSPAKFKVLADFLMEQYGKRGISVDTLVKQQIAKAKRNGRDIDYDTAFEEVVADSMETMLADGKVVEKLAALKQKDKGLWNMVKKFFSELAAKIRSVYEGLSPDSIEGQYVAGMKDAIDKIQELFTDALVDASENYSHIGEIDLAEFSEAKTTDGESLFQYRAMEADKDIYRDMLKTANIMSDTEIDSLFDTIDSAMEIIKENLEALDYAWEADIDDRAYNPVKPNSDSLYQVSVDFSTLCRKRLLQQAIQTHLQEALNKPLTKEEGIAIRDALMAIQEEGRQIEIACALCYVESARMKSPAQIKKFINNRESVIKDFFASKSDDVKADMKKAELDVRKRLGVGDTALKKLPGKTAKEIRDAKKAVKANYNPTAKEQAVIDAAKGMSVSDFTSPEGLENLAKNHRDLFDAYTSYIRNATKSKGIENDTWWRAGDSSSIGDTLIANMNAENGLRSQSWSDFQVIHLLDYIAATIELSTRKAKMQAYSKVPDYVELMGNTGQMINLSLIPGRVFSGTLDYDSTEGMEYKRALELRNKYHSTVGTICIGIDNTQIQMLLSDANIDYVIPYHRSGMAKAVRKSMHIPTWSEYENYQSESELSRADAKKQAEKYGVKLLDENDPNYQKHTSFSEWFDIKVAKQIAKMENANPSNKAMQKKYGVMYGGYMAMQSAADTYLKMCAERGISPKFSNEKADFTSEENYWKLLIDRKMVDNVTGEIIEQQAVKPVFDQGEILRILNDELERYPGVKADQEYATRKVVQNFLSGKIKGGMSSKAIADVMKAPVDNVTNTNILASSDEVAEYGEEKLSDRDYSYNALISKPDMEITSVIGNVPTNRADVIAMAKRNAAKVGKFNPQNGSVSVHVKDIGTDVILGTDGLKHGLRRKNASTNSANYIATLNAGEIIQNSIRINDMKPQKADATGSYILIGVAKNTSGDIYIVRSVVNKFGNELAKIDVLYAINAKKESVALNAPRFTAKPLSVTDSTISIANLLDYVNQYFPDILPKDVLKHYNHTTRPKGDAAKLGERVLYSDRTKAPTFYSHMGRVIEEMKQNKIATSDVVRYLTDPKRGVKSEEIKWSGIETWLDGKKSVTKAELQEFVAGSQLQIGEEMHNSQDDGYEELTKLWQKHFGMTPAMVFGEEFGGVPLTRESMEQVFDEYRDAGRKMPSDKVIDKMLSLADKKESATRWGDYKLDGGKNYRELVFTMPDSSYSNQAMKGHWGKGGVLAHARLQDFKVNGKKMLFVEEIQSDWHNEGHKRGYREKGVKTSEEIGDESARAYREFYETVEGFIEKSGESANPALLANLFYGEEDAYDMLRNNYNLSEDEMQYIDTEIAKETKRRAETETAPTVESAPDAPFRDTYQEFVMKRLIRMAAEEGYDSIGWTTAQIQSDRWSDQYAEGYRIEYDQDIPKFLRKYGKKWGATVGTATLKGGTEVWSMPITDSMKDSVLYEGQVMYSDRTNAQLDYVNVASKAVMTTDRIDYLIEDSGAGSRVDYANSWITSISPTEFLNMTLTAAKQDRSAFDKFPSEWNENSNMDTYDYMGELKKNMRQTPYLAIDITTGEVVGHEGRHRMRALERDGIKSAEIRVEFRDEDGMVVKYSPDGKRLQIKDAVEIINQFGTGQTATIKNVIPLNKDYRDTILDNYGEATSTSEDDIRYQDRDTSSISPRSLLANALESTIDTSTQEGQNELRKLTEYKEMVGTLDELTAKLNELRSGLFTKGTDGAKRKQMQEEATKIANRISIYDKKLLTLEASKPLKKVLDREKAQAVKRQKQKDADVLKAYKDEAEAKLKQQAEYYSKSRKNAIEKVKESRAKTEAKAKLQKLVLETSKWISYPKKDDVKCPDILRVPYADLLQSIDFSSKTLLETGEKTKNDIRIDSAMHTLANAIERIKNAQNPEKDTVGTLDSGYLDLPVHFVDQLREMAEKFTNITKIGGDFTVNGMSSEEIKNITKLLRTLNHSIREMSTLYSNMRFAKVEELGDNSISFMEELGEIDGTTSVGDFAKWDNALPYYAFKRFGDGGESVFEELMDAQDKMAFLAKAILKFRESAWTSKEAKAWSEDTHTIDLPSGNTLTLTTADAMSIYCLSRRDNNQGLNHLTGGGVRVLGQKNGAKVAKDSRANLDLNDVVAICATLDDRQKAVAESIQEFMSTVCSEWGNEISMKRFLTKDFTEQRYFPIQSNDEVLSVKDPQAQQSDLYRLLNISATKPLTPKANNSVIIRSIFDVFTEHTSDMARLNAYGMALLDYMKWINYSEKSTNDDGQISVRGVRGAMNNAYGNKAMSYVINLIKDINGRFNDGGDHPWLMKMTRSAKTAAVGSSLRVAALQFTAYPRAAMVLSTANLAKGLARRPQISKAKEYCGIALWKSFGFYDTNIARSIEDQIKGTTNWKQKLIEFSLKGAEWGDAITWGYLWNACEYDVANSNKQLKVGTEEFNQAVAKKLREVVYSTQVVDSVLTRTQIMRNKSGLTQTATAFMSEPAVTYNILMDSVMQFGLEKRRTGSATTAWKKTGGKITKAVTVFGAVSVLTSLVESIIDAYRDDEDDEFFEKFGRAMLENSISNILPFNKIPFVADAMEAVLSWFGLGYFSTDRLDSVWLADIVKAGDSWIKVLGEAFGVKNTSFTVYKALYDTVKALSSSTGVAYSGIVREVVTLWNNTAGAADPELKIKKYEN